MRAVFDTNVYISFLLAPDSDRVPTRLMEFAANKGFVLCVCGDQIEELRRTVGTKPHLVDRIGAPNLDGLSTWLRGNADVMEELSLGMPGIVRDAKDEYLIAHAIAAQADYLVTGDRVLLVLERMGDVRIVSPAEFFVLLKMEEASGEPR